MKYLRKLVAGMVAVGLFSSLFVGLASAQSTVTAGFDDVYPWHDNREAIEFLKDQGIVVGYEDGTFGIARDISRAEFLKIVMEAKWRLDEEEGKSQELVDNYDANGCFQDVEDQWYGPYVCEAADLGYVDGYEDGYFYGDREVNFAEASKIIANVIGLELDAEDDETWFHPYVEALEEVSAIPNSVDKFDHLVSRSEMSEIAHRLLLEDEDDVSNTYENIKDGKVQPVAGAKLQQFGSCSELDTFVEENYEDYYYWFEDDVVDFEESFGDDDGAADFAPAPSPAPGPAAESVAQSVAETSSKESDFSETNVQVKGVDEADVVKNDGQYIYYIRKGEVVILQADPLKEIGRLEFAGQDFYAREMYLDGDQLVVVGREDYSLYPPVPLEGAPALDELSIFAPSLNFVKVAFVDVSDRSNPVVEKDFAFEGNYTSSRKVGDQVYLVGSVYGDYYYEENKASGNLPRYRKGDDYADLVGCEDVWYMPEPGSTDYTYVIKMPTAPSDVSFDKQVILGASGTVFSSKENLYIAEADYAWNWDSDDGSWDRTLIHKFALDDLGYVGRGVVPGTVLNQFSMDEYQGNFRVATTSSSVWWNDEPTSNNMYVLDSEMEVIGWIEGIAPGEEIYSARYVGDRAYMVTFRVIDPLYVIDLAAPKAPKILGELKIPGYSDYLHPFGDDYLIGVGKEAGVAQDPWGDFAWFQGMKLAMFDVSDVENPVQLHNLTIGDRGTDSEVLRNHKAFLFDLEKGLMAFPLAVAEVSQDMKSGDEPEIWSYGERVFQGAHVYDVSVENGFELRGAITHYSEEDLLQDGRVPYGGKDVKRIIYIGDSFFTLSQHGVKASTMEDVTEEGYLEFGL